VEHDFLDIARDRLLPFKRKKTPLPMCWDRLEEFRDIVWFLILAGYSPTFICEFFRVELPNLFPKLSKEGVTSSVRKTQKLARDDQFLIDDDLADVLQFFEAGPWAHDAPDWLRLQYGVPLAEPKSGGKDSRKGKDSGKDVAGESVGAKSPEEFGREDAFWAMWSKYKAGCPGAADPTSEEVVLGVNQGISAILARREAAGVSVSAATGQVAGVPAVGSPVGSVVTGVPAGPGGFGVGVDSEPEKSARFLDEVALAELARGGPLNLSPAG